MLLQRQDKTINYSYRLGDTNIKSDDILEFRVDEFFPHPGFFRSASGGLKNDIGILKLSKM